MAPPEAASAGTLRPVRDRGWRRGLPNLMGAGFRAWWGTSTWWVQVLIWVAVTNLPLAAILWNEEAETTGISGATIFAIMSMFAAVAVAIIMQEEIVGEKKSGTAEWILSKPVSRAAFVLAKLIPNGVGVVATMAVAPGLVAWAQLTLAGAGISPIGMTAGLAVISLNLLFYLTLTLMLGTLFASAGPVIGIALAVAFGQQLVVQVPFLAQVLPLGLVAPFGQADVSNASALMLGQPLPFPAAIPSVAIACIAFTAIAIRQFERTEL